MRRIEKRSKVEEGRVLVFEKWEGKECRPLGSLGEGRKDTVIKGIWNAMGGGWQK